MSNYFGQKIRKVRKSKGMLLRQLAACLEVDTALISKIEKGDRVTNREHLRKISKALGIDEKDLMTLWLADKIERVITEDTAAYFESALNLIQKNYHD